MVDTPVAIEDLSKSYGTVRAVDHLSFSVEAGQVCGLLGPNGAGKTTALRMLVGLVRPTGGETRLFGQRVTAGARELRRVGTMIEHASFVPHLNGIDNLRLYWEAGGDRFADADVDRALAVAGLGDAIKRRVKTYSQGMRQRLGIARSLLGNPELLVYDEPTNGLDPQEMRAVRALIRRVADEGHTVLLSSHILSEVEQVCSHAVVMDRGRHVAAGTVAELVASGASAYVEVDDPSRATSVLAALSGVEAVVDEAPGLVVRLAGATRPELVAALVGAGIGVQTVTSRHALEEAFLGLVGEETERHIGEGA
ncbi:MAG: ATP-binding cassette domain-containing protein [Acidimicrobiia bacterium]|nr:ATP-binding cassette domain-containing protein [Acidimicrobiia bacterium]